MVYELRKVGTSDRLPTADIGTHGARMTIEASGGLRLRHQALHRRGKLPHVVDQAVWLEIRNRNVGISEFDPDDGNAGAPRNPDVRAGIANHDRRGEMASGACDGLLQYRRIGLRNSERIGATYRRKT